MKKFCISFVLCMSILLNLPVLEVSAKNKPLRAPDGRLVLEGMSSIATDGDKIYYSLYGQQVGCYSIKQKKNLHEKLSIMAKEWGEYEYEKPFSHFSVQGDYLYGMTQTYSSGCGIYDNGGIYRRKKNGKKFKKLADAVNFVVSGKYIYYVKLEGIYKDEEGCSGWKENSIWRMDLDGKNKKRIKNIKASRDTIHHVSLYKSNKNIYYGYSIYDGKYHFKLFFLDGKRIKENFYIDHSNYITDNFYLKDIKKRIDTKNYTQIKVGSFKKGKWEFKTILNRKQESYLGAIGINRYIIIVKYYSNEEGDRIELYDINGKFIKTLKKGIFFAA